MAAKLHFLHDQAQRHSCEQDNQRSKLFPKNHSDQRELACHVPRSRSATSVLPADPIEIRSDFGALAPASLAKE